MGKLFFYCFVIGLVACNQPNSIKNIAPIKVINLKVPEPSGITIANDSLLIVSDSNGTIYKTSMEGAIGSKIKTHFKDLEGISFNESAQLIYVIDESSRKLITLNLLGQKKNSLKIKGKQKFKNSGLEAVCFQNKIEKTTSLFYIFNEKEPKQLLVVNSKGKILYQKKLKFSKDISGCFFDVDLNSIWVVSDESQAIYKLNLKGKLLSKYKIPVYKPEGIAIKNNRLFIVSDAEHKLYVFKKPS